MTSVDVFDPAMCCTTGVCGPQIEPHLARFEADLRWLAGTGAQVSRHNLGQEPGAFADNTVVRAILQAGGAEALPVILVDGRLRWTGHYPTRDELAATVNVSDSEPTACCTPADQTEEACCAPAAPAPSRGCC